MAADSQPIDIHQRINMRGLVADWLKYQQERFQQDLEKKVYNRVRSSKKRPLSRTMQLKNNWRYSMNASGDDVHGAQYSFMLYGRFIDMGVGKGTDYALSKYQGIRANGEKRKRRPVRWYSKRKGYELHRLRELMAKHHIDISLDALENALSSRVEVML